MPEVLLDLVCEGPCRSLGFEGPRFPRFNIRRLKDLVCKVQEFSMCDMGFLDLGWA